MKLLKKTTVLIWILAVLLGCSCAIGCGRSKSSGDAADMAFCKASDFESVKSQWEAGKKPNLQEVHTSELVVNEDYYFIYAIPSNAERNGLYELDFGVKTWGDLLYDSEAVTIQRDGIVAEESVKVQFDREGNLYGVRLGEDIKYSYVAIPFSPLHAGMMYVECFESTYGTTVGAPGHEKQQLYATVMSGMSELDAGESVTVSNLSYSVVGQELYESGQLDDMAELPPSSEVVSGLNYMVVDFDATSKSSVSGDIYCGIYMYAGAWNEIKLEQANTSKSIQSDLDGGKVLDFSYSAPQNTTKRIRTVFSFNVLEPCLIDCEFFVYGDQVNVAGITYSCNSFTHPDISTLTYRIDKNAQICYVSGYEKLTEYVIVPRYYQGYPVVGIDEKVFEACSNIEVVRLNEVRTVASNVFADCTALKSLDLGKKLNYIDFKAFKGCTSLTSVVFPKTLEIINTNAFLGCTSLERATFMKTSVWESSSEVVSAPNAKKLREGKGPWRFVSAMGIDNAKITFIHQQAYNAGEHKGDAELSGETRLAVNTRYYAVVDFDHYFLSGDIEGSNRTWSVHLQMPFECDITLKEIVGSDLWYRDAGGGIVFLDYVDNGEDWEPLRLVFEVIPRAANGGAYARVSFGGSVYYWDKLEYVKSITPCEMRVYAWNLKFD